MSKMAISHRALRVRLSSRCFRHPDWSGSDDDASCHSNPEQAKPRAGSPILRQPPILLYNEHRPCSVSPKPLPRHPQGVIFLPTLHDVLPLSLTAYALPIGLVHNLAPIRNSDGGPAHRVILDAGCAVNRVPSFTTAWGELTTT